MDNNIGTLLDVVQRETLRTRLLFALDEYLFFLSS
jgi:hypothetical protein